MQMDGPSTADAFRDSARDFLADMAGPPRLREQRQSVPGFDRRVWAQIAEAGWTSILIPEDFGGLGLGLRELLAVVEEIGRRPLPEPFIAAGVHPVALLMELPSSALRDELLAAVASGKRLIGVAWQEKSGELEPDTLRTSVHEDGGAILSGSKQWVAPGQGADGWLVVAQGPSVFWVEATASVHVDPLPRVDGSSMANLRLERAPARLLLEGSRAASAVARANDIARLAQAAELLGVARHAYECTLDYLKTRVQFGKPIGANQAIQHRMVDAYIDVELTAACIRDVVDQYEHGYADLAALASRAKARSADAAVRLTRLAVQFHGAIGYTDEFDIGLYWKRALQLASWLGNAEAHRSRYLRLQRDHKTAGETPELGPLPPGDTDWAALTDDAFRGAVRSFLHAHYPAHLRHAPRRLHWGEIKDWYLALSRQGWIAPAWPKEHGGMALSPDKLLAFIEEFEDFGAARLPDQGLINLGPVLIHHGTPEQKHKWLPRIIAGEHIWCQGYSEPDAGSDLASLRCEALPDGHDFIVNGQKIWTTLAQDATHIFLLVRTDKAAKKQQGISFLLADLKTPGITVRPIRNIAGEEEFCEVFLDNVRVPAENLVGELNQGWGIAKALLGFERLFVGSPKTCHHALGLLRQLAQAQGKFTDGAFVSDFAVLQLDLDDLQAAYAGFADIVKRGEQLPASVSMLKIWATETYTRIAAKLVEAAAEDGGTRQELQAGGTGLDPLAPLFNATVTTIYGGTNEIQRNILARHVLGLPS
jgi:alkylation response protein AidB-like acyl-CoA dehydrogenase